MKRRTFLKVGFAAGASTILIGVWGFLYTKLSAEEVIEKIVRYYIRDENLVNGAAARFAKDFALDFALQNWAGSMHKLRMSLAHFYGPFRDLLPGDIGTFFDEYERRIITVFVQSSDISDKPGDLKKPIDYIALTIKPTCNPFARLLP